jgi:hypothetical protein
MLMKSFVYLRALRAFVVEIWLVPLASTSTGINATSVRIKRLIQALDLLIEGGRPPDSG